MQHRLKETWLGAFALLALGCGLGLAVNPWRRLPVRWQQAGSLKPCPGRVTLPTAKDWFVGQRTLFVDLRDSQAYRSGHIPGAVQQRPQDKSRRLVIYGPQAEPTAQTMCQDGYDVYLLEPGLAAWREAGCPLQRGSAP